MIILRVLLFSVFLASIATAQNNSTITVNGYGTNTTSLIIGNTGTNNSLQVSIGGSVTNTGDGIVGNSYAASNNFVIVTDVNSLWINTTDLYVGKAGTFNTLTITNGGQVFSRDGYIGFGVNGDPTNGAFNSVLVTGDGSLWNTTRFFQPGVFGPGNQLTIANSGRVNSVDAYIGANGGSNTLIQVTGAGSVWSNAGTLRVGYVSANNQLTISGGGRVDEVGFGRVGEFTSSSNNLLLVTGINSLWNDNNNLTVGFNGAGNTMIVTNGAKVVSFGGYVGSDLQFNSTSGVRNTVIVTGAGSQWTNTATSGNNGMIVGYNADSNSLMVSAGGRVDGLIGIIGWNNHFNSAVVTDSNSLWNSTGAGSFFEVGVLGHDNRLTVTNGGRVNSTDFYIGGGASSSNNAVIVTGSGSILTNSGTFRVGAAGASNSLTLANGGQLYNGIGKLGESATSVNNYVLVTDSNTLWNNTGNLLVGDLGAGNTLVLSNGARISSAQGLIGNTGPSASNNTVIVTGAGTLWTNTATGGNNGVSIGQGGNNNQLHISNGGRVDSFDGFVGFFGSGNSALITGSNSLWNTSAGSAFEVGVQNGSINNSMVISNGGRLNSVDAYIGNVAGASNNFVVVTGASSQWFNASGTLRVGVSSASNRLTIASGGRVDNGIGTLGQSATSINNYVLVTDSNTLWNNTGNLLVGDLGAGNTLVLSNSARINSAQGLIGYTGTSASNNTVIITGAGTIWSNSLTGGNNGVIVGGSGNGNRLTISDGAQVYSFVGFLGFPSTDNSVLITGSNSLWSTSGAGSAFEVGTGGNGNNSLTISNGARLTSLDAYIGNGGNSNTVVVTGANSAWSNGVGTLRVGFSGINSRMTISNGGRVDDGAARIGESISSSNNVAVVDGTNSLWNNTGILSIGLNGGRNTLIITNGGMVISQHGDLGSPSTSSSTGNTVIVTGAGS